MNDKRDVKAVIAVTSRITDVGDIEIETNVLGAVQRGVLRMEDQAVRSALIKLGWTPPGERQQ
ncbi:hypothetical protein JN531_004005 [Flagellatimonas centrodinii]|uniref:hypothetical protein n=1 Tax=Flagellatimonas centrodinii TaxID=2806210 RepID=UPI001FEDA6E9|nr:hypothetical protein [Flagellatimonas centrodinii]ULQ47451.1 hypothetical protein JN531_004005 [Flagellatimonas centrodinii]